MGHMKQISEQSNEMSESITYLLQSGFLSSVLRISNGENPMVRVTKLKSKMQFLLHFFDTKKIVFCLHQNYIMQKHYANTMKQLNKLQIKAYYSN